MQEVSKVSFVDRTHGRQEVTLDVTDYMAAADHKMSLSQFYANKYRTDEAANNGANTLEQFAASAGIRVRADESRGIPATNMKEIMHGMVDLSAGTIVRPSSNNNNNVAARILFPEVMMQMINDQLLINKEDYLLPWENAIAVRSSVVGPRVDQPTINVTAPEGSAAQPISQLAEPAVMVSISLGQRSYTIPTMSIGLQIADQALEASTIDIVAITLAAQARGERIRRLENDMVNIISGDTDYGINPVTFVNASTFDAAIPGVPITHKAWVKWRRSKYQYMSLTHMIMDEDTALAVDSRTNKPTILTDLTGDVTRFPAGYTIANAGMTEPTVLMLPTSIVGANRIVGFDRNSALQQITNISASYSAIEEFVLRRSKAMRFDYGTALFKLFDQAFSGLNIGA